MPLVRQLFRPHMIHCNSKRRLPNQTYLQSCRQLKTLASDQLSMMVLAPRTITVLRLWLGLWDKGPNSACALLGALDGYKHGDFAALNRNIRNPILL